MLHNKSINNIKDLRCASGTAKELFDYLEQNPIIDIRKTSDELVLVFSIVPSVVKRLEEIGILVQTNNTNRNRVLDYEDYLEILRKDT